MAPAKKATTKKKAPAKKAPAKKTTAKKAVATPVVEAAPAAPAVPALPAPPAGFTWSLDPATGQIVLIPSAGAVAEKAEEVRKASGKTIRNLRGVPVHMRLTGTGDKPYRIELQPRGMNGDTKEVPAACTQDHAFIRSYDRGLFEIITKTEAGDIDYPVRGFQSRPLNIITSEQSTVAHQSFETNSKGQVTNQKNLMPAAVQQNPSQGANVYESVGPRVVPMPGSDPQLTAQFQSVQARRPDAQAANVMQSETGRAEHAPDKLLSKGIMENPLPTVVGIQRVQEF
jgi:hypothetical protein